MQILYKVRLFYSYILQLCFFILFFSNVSIDTLIIPRGPDHLYVSLECELTMRLNTEEGQSRIFWSVPPLI